MAVRLVWGASPPLLAGLLTLLLLQAILLPLQLVLSRAVIDRATLDLGLLPTLDSIATQLPLLAWIGLAAAALALGQLIQPFSLTLQALAGDRITGYITEQLIRAANRWQGLARFEDPAFADDLHRARSHVPTGASALMIFIGRAAVELFTAGSLALVLLGLHPLVPILIILATLPQFKRQREFTDRTFDYIYFQTPEAHRLQYCREALLFPQPAKDVHLYGLGPFFRPPLRFHLRQHDRVAQPGAPASCSQGVHSQDSGQPGFLRRLHLCRVACRAGRAHRRRPGALRRGSHCSADEFAGPGGRNRFRADAAWLSAQLLSHTGSASGPSAPRPAPSTGLLLHLQSH